MQRAQDERRFFPLCDNGGLLVKGKDVKHTINFTLFFRLFVANGVIRYGIPVQDEEKAIRFFYVAYTALEKP